MKRRLRKMLSFVLMLALVLSPLPTQMARAAASISPGEANRTSDGSATVTFTPNEAGTYYYAIVDDEAAAPTIDMGTAGTNCDTTEQTVTLTDLTAGAKDIYIVVKDSADALSNVLKMDIPAYDNVTPTLAAGRVTRVSITEATVKFTSGEAGAYYYAAVGDGAGAPAIETSGEGSACEAGIETTISLTGLSSGAKDVYIVVKDAAGNISTPLKINIESLPDTENGGIYLTEIYPNDISRSSVYGNSDDHMEYVELTNISNVAVSFNEEYALYYEYPSGGSYLQKLLTVKTLDGSTDVTIGAGETVVLWDRRDDVSSHATEKEFRDSWLIPDDVKIFAVSGQTGFATDDRGFTVKRISTDEVVSHYRYYTDNDTSDGLAVHLAVPDSGSEMIASLKNSFGSPGVVYSDQLNRDEAAPDDLTPDGLYITEIHPNDIDRSGEYGCTDNLMECAEFFNTTDQDIDFNADYSFAYLYKASYYIQPVTTVANAENGNTSDTSGVIIPAHGSAVIWCYRAEGLAGSYTSFPTEEELRAAYGIPDSVPVYAQTGQSGWGNTDRGIAILKKNGDSRATNVSYYFWNGVTDLGNGTSVDLKISADGPKMDIYKALGTTNMGVVAGDQYTFYSDDKTAPKLTAGASERTGAGSATVKFTSDEAGAYYYKVVPDGASAPVIDTTGDGTACDAAEQTIALTGLASSGAQDIYIVVRDAAGNLSGALKIDINAYEPDDKTAPKLTAGQASRLSTGNATVRFTSDEAGTYYYEVVPDGASAPTIDTTGDGTACDTTEQVITPSGLTSGAKDIYIVVKDAEGNVSDALKLDVESLPVTENGGIYLTEIYPNDVNRASVYGNSDDHMEYVELTNIADAAIPFNEEYGLYYEYPSGGNYILKLLTVKTLDGSPDVTIGAGETVVLWDRRDDITPHATEEDFRDSWLIPNDVKIFVVSGQAGFTADDRGFTVKRKSTDAVVSHYRYYTDVDTSDGLAVHLAVPDSGSEMIASTKNSFGSPGVAYSDQLNREKTAPDDLTPEGLYVTEIRPNDTARGSLYGDTDADDFMECAEVLNTTDQDIDFNASYTFAYLYKASFLPQPVTTIANAENGNTSDTSGVIIPAHGSAVIWCYRAEGLAGKYTSFPTEEDFRAAYDIPENVPVYAQTGQNGWGNTDRGIAILKKNGDGRPINVSYFFWNGVTDLKDNNSVDLKISADGPKMDIYKALNTTNMGVVAEDQYTFYPDSGDAPALELLDDFDSIREGDSLRIPYYYAGSDSLPVTSIDFCYKLSGQDTYTVVSTSSFAIYNKFYAFIDNAELLGADYVDYYLKAYNAYRCTSTEERRIAIQKDDDYTGLRVNFDGVEAENGAVLSGTVDVSAKNFGDTSAGIAFALDGKDVQSAASMERYAYFTFDYSGVDAYFKNALTTGDQVLSVFAKCSEIPSTDSLSIPVPQSLFTYNEDGSAGIELTLRAGTYGSSWEADTAENNDDFTAGNFKLHLTDGTVLNPATTVDMNSTNVDPAVMTKMGDSANCTICITMTFNIPADKVDAASFVLDTTALPDGTHSLSVVSGSSQKDLSFTVDNSIPEEPEEKTIDVNVDMTVDGAAMAATVVTGSDVKSVTVYEAKNLGGITVKQGAGDSTASAADKTGTAATVSYNGDYPYQILEIPVADAGIDALRVKLSAGVNYDKPVQLYVLNTSDGTWDIIDNTTRENGVITGICPLENHVADGVAKVLVQARGTESSPYTEADAFTTVKNGYDWDGTNIPEQYDFSVAWITDTQYYAEQYHDNFDTMTDWIVDQADNLNIRYVVHTGDIVDEFNEEDQFKVASDELAKFETADIPYGVLAGNHDVAHGNMRYGLYWKYFGESRYKDDPVYGGSYKNNLGHYDLVTVDGEELVFIYMSWDIYYPETDWINSVLAKYPDRKAVICTHCGINAAGTQSYISNFLLKNVCKENKNVIAILNGHYHGSSLNFVGFDDDGDGMDDRTVYQICTDYQSAPGGGEGYIKMIYFDLANNKIYMNSYSPVLNDFNYYDTPKLNSYGIGTLQSDIDITELSVDFDRDVPKTLDVSAVEATGLSTNELGSAQRSGAKTNVSLAVKNGQTINAYAVLKDTQGNVLGYTDAVSFTAGDVTAPTLVAGGVQRASDSAATVRFTSDEAGTYYYKVVNDGAVRPAIDTAGVGEACGTTENTITLTNLTAGAKGIYIMVKDAAGNVSAALQIDIPAYVPGGVTSYNITAAAGNGGSISPSGAVSVSAGGGRTFTITPDNGYNIASVWVDGADQGAVTSYTFSNVTANHTITASFAAQSTATAYTLTITAGSGGSVTAGGSYKAGAVISITATPASGYRFLRWTTSNGGSFGNSTSASTTFTMPANATAIKATFAAKVYTNDNDDSAAALVEELIGAIGNVTINSEGDIMAARAAYNALTSAQKGLVSNYAVLRAAESALAQLKEETETLEDEDTPGAAGTEMVKINGMTYEVDAQTAAAMRMIEGIAATNGQPDAESVISAYLAYQALSDEQKASVANHDELETQMQALARLLHADQSSGVTVDGIDWYIQVIGTVTPLGSDEAAALQNQLGSNKLLLMADISLCDLIAGTDYEPGMPVTVRIPAPEMAGYDGVVIVHKKDDGSIEYLEATLEDGMLVFTATGFSYYGVVGYNGRSPLLGGASGLTWLIWAGAGATAVLIVLAVLLIMRRKKPQDRTVF